LLRCLAKAKCREQECWKEQFHNRELYRVFTGPRSVWTRSVVSPLSERALQELRP
jgi:hypothetical protein